MTENMADKATPSYDNAIYYELSPKLTWLVRIVNIIVILMVLISLILIVVKGHDNNSYYLLICNLGISIIVCSVVNWWYRSGDLGSEKYWFVLLLGLVILFQCISFDIFIYKEESSKPTPTPSHTPPTRNSTHIYTWTSMLPASTNKKF